MPAKFSLAGLLRLRGIQQDQAAGVLAAANREVTAVDRRRSQTADQLAASSSSADSRETLLAIVAARASARSMFLELDGIGAQAAARAETARHEFTKAKSDTAALDKLAERHRVQSTAEELRTEQNALDEISAGSRAPVAADRA